MAYLDGAFAPYQVLLNRGICARTPYTSRQDMPLGFKNLYKLQFFNPVEFIHRLNPGEFIHRLSWQEVE